MGEAKAGARTTSKGEVTMTKTKVKKLKSCAKKLQTSMKFKDCQSVPSAVSALQTKNEAHQPSKREASEDLVATKQDKEEGAGTAAEDAAEHQPVVEGDAPGDYITV